MVNKELKTSVLITGGAGYLGSQVVQRLANHHHIQLVSMDIREVPKEGQLPGVTYLQGDVGNADFVKILQTYQIQTVIHLAAIVMPAKPIPREVMYQVDVIGTKRLLEACVETGVKRFITTSSGAAYGYYPDNPSWLTEDDPIRGNKEFAYAYHKRLGEEMLADYRERYPSLQQTILRVGTILGKSTKNQITALLDKNPILGIRGTDSPFVMIWDQDLVRLLEYTVFTPQTGIYNVAGDGALSVQEIASIQGKRCVKLPASVVKIGIAILRFFRLVPYGPEQVRFIQYRPVLSNQRLKTELEFIPEKTTREVFEFYLKNRD